MASRISMPGVYVQQRSPNLLFQIHGLHVTEHRDIFKDFGIEELPADRRSCMGAEVTLMWNGPGMWLFESETRSAESTLLDLRRMFENTDATVTDLSSARFIVRVIGSSARSFLKKGCPVDIDSLTRNDVVSSLMGHLGATIHCLGNEFDVYVLQSFWQDFWEWAQKNAREFNV